MTRKEAIDHIEALYPADSEYNRTAEIGQEFLEQAKHEAGKTWREEPTEVLIKYANLCLLKERRMQLEMIKKG